MYACFQNTSTTWIGPPSKSEYTRGYEITGASALRTATSMCTLLNPLIQMKIEKNNWTHRHNKLHFSAADEVIEQHLDCHFEGLISISFLVLLHYWIL